MDRSGPVATRTRFSEAIYFKNVHEEIKKKNKKRREYDEGYDVDSDDTDDESVRESVVGGSGGGRRSARRKGIAVGRGKGKKRKVVDSGLNVCVACSEEGDNGVEFLGFGAPGSNERLKAMAVVKSRNVLPIEVIISSDDDEEEEEEKEEAVIGERGDEGFSCVNSSFSSIKTGNRLNEAMVEKEVVLSENEMSATNSLKAKGGESSGVAEINVLEEGPEVYEIVDSDSDQLESSSNDDLDEWDESSEEDNDDVNDEDYNIDDERPKQSMPTRAGLDTSQGEESDDYNIDDEGPKQSMPTLAGRDTSQREESEEEEAIDDSTVTKRGINTENVEEVEEIKEVKAKETVLGIKRRNSYSGKENNKDSDTVKTTPKSNCVARRTRSKFARTPEAKTVKSRTVRNHRPTKDNSLCRDDDVRDVNGRFQDKENEKKINSKKRNVDHLLAEEACRDDDSRDGYDHDYQTKHSVKKAKSRKENIHHLQIEEGIDFEEDIGKSRARKRASKKSEVIQILLDSIWNKNDGIVEELVSSEDTIFDQETPTYVTKWKFHYPVKDSLVADNSDDDNGDKSLWMEFDFALRLSDIGSTYSSKINNEDSITPVVKFDRASLCSRGQHQFIINEEVGVICKFCSCVDLEMKYFSPSFDKQSWKTTQNTNYSKMDGYRKMDLQFPDSDCDSELECHPHLHTKGTVWDKVPGIEKSLYQHQREGFEFIWKSIAGSIYLHELQSIKFDGGSGCIISHAPGTGKTRLILSFVQAYMKVYDTCKPVIIAPSSMLYTWEEQCKQWKFPFTFHNLNKKELSGNENKSALKLLGACEYEDQSVDISTKHGLDMKRLAKIYSWKKGKSVLGISYTLFERLIRRGEVDIGEGKKRHRIPTDVDFQIRKILLELPGLLVLDEGHTPRNAQSRMWKALVKIQTEKRIILSGTPFQNNFDELYNTLCLVRPKFLDTASQSHWRHHFKMKRGRKPSAAKDTWASLTNAIGKEAAGNKLKELRAMIDPFVHVYKGTILQERLPGLRESLVVLKPHPSQETFLNDINCLKNTFEKYHMVSLLSAHPSLVLSCPALKEKYIDRTEELTELRLNTEVGVKTKFLMELIQLSDAMDEKVLVFSQYVDPLMLIKDQLKSHFNWNEGNEVLYMDGQRNVKERQSSINVFNEARSEAKVLLASTGACSEGINLVGASRVVLLDKVWNPSVERQAISRAYRLGQERVVYIYHLLASGTLELEKYCRQSEKERLSELVFSSTQNDCDRQKISEILSDDKILEEMAHHEKLKDIFEKIVYQPKDANVIDPFVLFQPQFLPESFF